MLPSKANEKGDKRLLNELLKLNEKEKQLVLEIPALITVMIGFAEKSNKANINWNEKIKLFSTQYKDTLIEDYYERIIGDFFEIINELLDILPEEIIERNKSISERIAMLNDIFDKINYKIANELYKSFLKYAEYVMKASGGLLSLSKIHKEVEKWTKLEMLNPPCEH